MRKTIVILTLIFFVAACKTTSKTAVNSSFSGYLVVNDTKHPDEKILIGDISPKVLDTDTVMFKWYKDNLKYAYPDITALNTFKSCKDSIQMVVFCGTWCEDSHNLLPTFLKLLNQSGFEEKNLSLIAVDRHKQSLNNFPKAFHITKVPTFIVMRNGKEIGRVEEYGAYGQPDKEVGELISKAMNYKL